MLQNEPLNLFELLSIDSIKEGVNKKTLTPSYESSSEAYWINLKTKYFFKEDMDQSYIYKELLVETLAKEFMIPTVITLYAKLGNKYGELSKDFNIPNYDCLTGRELFQKYNGSTLGNNLEDISIVFKNICNIETCENCLLELQKRMIFDFLTMQSDRTLDNWGVFISKQTKNVSLLPLFDSNKSFRNYHLSNNDPFKMKLKFNKNKYWSVYEEFGDFFENLPKELQDYFYNGLQICSMQNIQKILNDICTRIPNVNFDIVKTILEDYERHYQTILSYFDIKERKEL